MLEGFEAGLRSVLAPDPHRDPVDFLEHNIRSIPYSPLPGPFRITNSPWLAEPLRALSDPEILEIGILGAVQMSKSWVIEAASCIIPVLMPGPTLILREIDRNAEDLLENRLSRLWEACPAVAATIGPDGIPKRGSIQFRGNTCWVLGANNERNLQSRSIRFILGDEVWLWPSGAIKYALARTTAYKWQSKVVLVSQGGHEGDDWSNWFSTTSRSVWTFKCPDCGTRQPWEWTQVIYPEAARTAGGWDLEAIRKGTTYKCKGCDTHFKDSNKVRAELNKSGEYVETNPNAPKSRRGFSYNSLCAQWGLTWGDLAVECIEAKRSYEDRADNTARREFVQQRLAENWREEVDEIKMENAVGEYSMGTDWDEEGGFVNGKATAGGKLTAADREAADFVRLRFMAVDVQRGGFYWIVRSWNGEGRSRLIGCGYVLTWGELGDLQRKNGVHAANVFVDCGDQKDEVLTACGTNGWVATRGDQRNEFPWKVRLPNGMTKVEMRPYSVPVVEAVGSKRAKVIYFSNLRVKDTLALLIRRGRHTRPVDVPDEYIQQMQSERRTVLGNGKAIWERAAVHQSKNRSDLGLVRKQNHFWDCEVIGLIPALGWKITGAVLIDDAVEAKTDETD